MVVVVVVVVVVTVVDVFDVVVVVMAGVVVEHFTDAHPPSTIVSVLYQQGALFAIGMLKNMLLDLVMAEASSCQQFKSWSNFEAS